jgi:hypothetical protein
VNVCLQLAVMLGGYIFRHPEVNNVYTSEKTLSDQSIERCLTLGRDLALSKIYFLAHFQGF